MQASLRALRYAAALASMGVLLLLVPLAGASEQGATTTTATPAPTPAPATPPTETGSSEGGPLSTQPPAGSTTTAPTSPQAPAGSEANSQGPQVRRRSSQPTSSAHPGRAGAKRSRARKRAAKHSARAGGKAAGTAAGRRAPSPAGLTPALPFALRSSLGVSSFFVESFQIPPFLLPIYQAAGTAYGVPWQVLAAINEIETDYGRDLSVSSAGAEGWMQFLPSSWAQYGVDANGDGYKDPYNPADAIFAAARYLHAAGGSTNIKAAVYSYNHSQAYVSSVMLRAQLLDATPPELLSAVTGLTEARFPVHAPSHFADGFAAVAAHAGRGLQMIAGTTIYSQPGAPVIAVSDGEVVRVGDSPTLGRFISLRDGYGNTYTYAQLGAAADVYPVLEPRRRSSVSEKIAHPVGVHEPPPRGPATAGAQPRSPLSLGAVVSGLALGETAALERAPPTPAPAPRRSRAPQRVAPAPTTSSVRVFRSGQDDVYLHPLRVGVQVIAGTVLGHLGSGAAATAGAQQAHMLFQIRPAGAGAPLIDPKPILDGWVALENTSTFHAKGEDPFLSSTPSAGQVLLESKGQLEQQVVRDAGIRMRSCERQDVQTGQVDARVLAVLELLSVSDLKPTVAGLRCVSGAPASQANPSARAGQLVKITAVNRVPVAGHLASGSPADATVRKLLALQGAEKPQRIFSPIAYPGRRLVVARPQASGEIAVAFGPPQAAPARAARALASPLAPQQWSKLIARLGEIPDPTVAGGPSSAAIADAQQTSGSPAGEGEAGGHR